MISEYFIFSIVCYWSLFSGVHPTRSILHNPSKKILSSRTVFKRKNIVRYITFDFLPNLLCIVQVSIELCSSQWKPPSSVAKTPTLKSSHYEKGLTLEIKLGPLFQGLVYPKYSKLKSKLEVMILDHFIQSFKCIGLKSFFFQKNMRTYTL